MANIDMDRLTKDAADGDILSQFRLGWCYHTGSGVEQDFTKAVEWYKRAATAGYAPAQNNLGVCYEYGYGLDKNRELALEWYRKAAEKGNEDGIKNADELDAILTAEKEKAKAKDKTGPDVKTFPNYLNWLFQIAAGKGYGFAEENPASAGKAEKKETGEINIVPGKKIDLNVPIEEQKDVLEAKPQKPEGKLVVLDTATWLKAAEDGNADAQNHMGILYCKGKKVERNYAEAVQWFNRAAAQGHITAINNLAVCYEQGIGVKKDLVNAAKLYTRAAEAGVPSAQHALANLYYNGEGVARDFDKSFELWDMAARQKYAPAQCNLGYSYYMGVGTDINFEKAAVWFKRAADAGYIKALYFLGMCYENGLGVERDTEAGAKYLRRAAQKGDPDAKKVLDMIEG